MWRWRLADRNCVSTYTRLSPLLMQFDSGISMSRYLAAKGTAGLARNLVSGYRRVPRPPPSTNVTIFRVGSRTSCTSSTRATGHYPRSASRKDNRQESGRARRLGQTEAETRTVGCRPDVGDGLGQQQRPGRGGLPRRTLQACGWRVEPPISFTHETEPWGSGGVSARARPTVLRSPASGLYSFALPRN